MNKYFDGSHNNKALRKSSFWQLCFKHVILTYLSNSTQSSSSASLSPSWLIWFSEQRIQTYPLGLLQFECRPFVSHSVLTHKAVTQLLSVNHFLIHSIINWQICPCVVILLSVTVGWPGFTGRPTFTQKNSVHVTWTNQMSTVFSK